jgi:hypothetical protein
MDTMVILSRSERIWPYFSTLRQSHDSPPNKVKRRDFNNRALKPVVLVVAHINLAIMTKSSNDHNNATSVESKAPPVLQPPSNLPGASAAPEEVRLFISLLLREQGVPQSGVEPIAAQWKIGRGREMRSYDPSIYFELFGAEYGWILYREIKLRIHQEKCCKLTYKYGAGELSKHRAAGKKNLMCKTC